MNVSSRYCRPRLSRSVSCHPSSRALRMTTRSPSTRRATAWPTGPAPFSIVRFSMRTSSPSTNIVADRNVPIAWPSAPRSVALRSNVTRVVVGSSPISASGPFPRGTWTISRCVPGAILICQRREAPAPGAASIAACTVAYPPAPTMASGFELAAGATCAAPATVPAIRLQNQALFVCSRRAFARVDGRCRAAARRATKRSPA